MPMTDEGLGRMRKLEEQNTRLVELNARLMERTLKLASNNMAMAKFCCEAICTVGELRDMKSWSRMTDAYEKLMGDGS